MGFVVFVAGAVVVVSAGFTATSFPVLSLVTGFVVFVTGAALLLCTGFVIFVLARASISVLMESKEASSSWSLFAKASFSMGEAKII